MIDEDDRGDWEHDVAKDKELDRRWEEQAMRRVIDSIWFDRTGIVRVRDDHGPDRFYIGAGTGLDQKEDERIISERGQKLHLEHLRWFFTRELDL